MSVNSRHDRAHRGQTANGRGGHETRAALMRLLEPAVTGAGFDLEDVVVTLSGKRRRLRVVVDADGGVSLDDVAVVSQAVSSALDENEAMGSAPYVLEVTSPGIDRPLTQARHWRRSAGRLVRASLTAGGEVTGRVMSAGDSAVILDVDGAQRRLGYDELIRGLVQVEFNRPDDDSGDGED